MAKPLNTEPLNLNIPLEMINGTFVQSHKARIKDINLTVYSGQMLSIIGPNGAGKSTLAQALSTDFPLTTGTLKVFGQSRAAHSRTRLAKHLAFLPQTSTLNFSFTVEEVVKMGRIPHDEDHQHQQLIVTEVLKALELNTLKHRPYTSLSGGEKQRTQIARVLAQVWDTSFNTPGLVILDEPTNALDLGHQQLIMNLLKSLTKQHISVVFITHDLNLALLYSDEVLLLQHGQILSQGSPDAVITAAQIEAVFGAKVHLTPIQFDGHTHKVKTQFAFNVD